MTEIDELIHELVKKGGSDLHLSAGRMPLLRVNGELSPLVSCVLNEEETKRLLYEIMPERNRREFEARNDTDFIYEIPQCARLRANVFRDRCGVGGAFRVIPATILTAAQLNLPAAITDLCHLSKGLVVVTGPTGSGISTTLAAMVDFINQNLNQHIITIEDPIEFIHADVKSRVNQREIHSHTESFAGALRAALRQDPNILLVGEMRDLETIDVALDAAETGQLVLGTLHTNSAAGAADRIIDAFPSGRQNQVRATLARCLKGVVAQVLCRRKEQGRIAAFEVLTVDRGIATLIRESRTQQIHSAMQAGGPGTQVLNEALVSLVRTGVVEPAEALRKAVDRDDLAAKYRQIGIPVPNVGAAA